MKNNNGIKVLYLPTLNFVRATAALLVLLAHSLPYFNFHSDIGAKSVTVFFTLSGFLITYLLLIEKEKTKSINIKKFYIRRILRIWPIYFLYLFLTVLYVLINENDFDAYNNLWYYVTFIPNYALTITETFPYLGHYWSLGVEEQFYIFWPLLFLTKNHFKTIFIFFITYFSLKIGVNLVIGGWSWQFGLLNLTKFDAMALGGIGAIILRNYNFHKLLNKYIYGGALLLILLSFLDLLPIYSIFRSNILAVSCVIFFLFNINVFGKDESILEHKVFIFLGKISFGLYVYHPLIQTILYKYCYHGSDATILNMLSFFIFSTLLSILVSWLSFNFYESPFLKLKHKQAVINSTNEK
ncbi:acyltransferase family protein [Flammeovirga aprica]|uniref:acyltransferase family protein n=1 Tax=Flammeovirga aprica TaxID=29528 RepID=UPI00197D582C|nr:acyltransferase [Flammeovirga aprica]